ncbi:MAG: PKD domain-containing protein [Candidatus Wildermuthbacteria bacterium]|nr:PKD domain-containing protein [Candidatus Wildermuthbacteria bacterium]
MPKKLIIILVLFLLVGTAFIAVKDTRAVLVNHNVSGFAWSENVGWISFNWKDCDTDLNGFIDAGDCGGDNASTPVIDYGVDIDENTKILSGYAWSPNAGWLSFNLAETGTVPGQYDYSSQGAVAQFQQGNNQLRGWARFLSGIGASGWDGWLKLYKHASDGGPSYGVTHDPVLGEFHGWAWGSSVVGWVSFNCAEGGPLGENVCGQSNYTVRYVANQPPDAKFSCNPGNCTGLSTGGLLFNNNSTDPNGSGDIVKSEWDIVNFGTNPDVTCTSDPLCNYTAQPMAAGSYTMTLTVTDSQGATDSESKSFTIEQAVEAGFMCSLDNATWLACETLSGQASQNELTYFKDDPALAEHSIPSEDADEITSRTWKLNGVNFSTGNNANPSTTLSALSNAISLTVRDDKNKEHTKTHTINAQLPFPFWQEISPF